MKNILCKEKVFQIEWYHKASMIHNNNGTFTLLFTPRNNK